MNMTMLLATMKHQSGTILGGMIDKIGFTSMAGFVGIKAAAEKDVIVLAETVNSAWGLPDWALLLTIIGTITFIIKNVIESRKAYLEVKINSRKLKDKE